METRDTRAEQLKHPSCGKILKVPSLHMIYT
jgi:hypothetical protein